MAGEIENYEKIYELTGKVLRKMAGGEVSPERLDTLIKNKE